MTASQGLRQTGVGVWAMSLLGGDARSRIAVVTVWLGLLTPLALNEPRTRTQVLRSLLDPIAIARGVIPMICLVGAALLLKPRLRPLKWREILLATFLGINLISTLWSAYPAATILKSGALIVNYALVMLLLDANTTSTDSFTRAVPVFAAVVLSSLIWLAVSPARALRPLTGPDQTPRLSGVFPAVNPNALGYLAAACVLAALVFALAGKSKKVVLLAVAVATACFAALLLTRTRSAYALLVVGGIYVIAGVWKPTSRRLLLGVLVSTAAVAVVIVVVDSSLIGFLTRHQTGITTLTGRTLTWSDGIQQWEKSPLLGFGYYAGHRLALQSHPGAPEIDTLDNTWIEVLVDTGIVGVTPLIALVGGSGWMLWRHLPLARPRISLVRQAAFIVCAIASLLSSSLESITYLGLLFAMVLFSDPP